MISSFIVNILCRHIVVDMSQVVVDSTSLPLVKVQVGLSGLESSPI